MIITLHGGHECLVDDDFPAELAGRKWYRSYYGYAVLSGKSKGQLKMHRIIMGDPSGLEVDHINGNRLDNRKSNLRVATHRQNLSNMKKSPMRGISKTKAGTYKVRIKHNYVEYRIGTFKTVEEAQAAYAEASQKLFGEFSNATIP